MKSTWQRKGVNPLMNSLSIDNISMIFNLSFTFFFISFISIKREKEREKERNKERREGREGEKLFLFLSEDILIITIGNLPAGSGVLAVDQTDPQLGFLLDDRQDVS